MISGLLRSSFLGGGEQPEQDSGRPGDRASKHPIHFADLADAAAVADIDPFALHRRITRGADRRRRR